LEAGRRATAAAGVHFVAAGARFIHENAVAQLFRAPCTRRAFCALETPHERSETMAKALSRFTIERDGDEFILHIEDEDGDTLELTASFEQLDLISESLEEHLAFDVDDPDEVDEEEEEDES
jgi:hypothetical protein